MVGKNHLPQNPTVDDMTPHERNFALLIQSWLDGCETPIDRQLVVECVIVLAKIVQRNPEVQMNEVIRFDVIVEEAIRICWITFQPEWWIFTFGDL